MFNCNWLFYCHNLPVLSINNSFGDVRQRSESSHCCDIRRSSPGEENIWILLEEIVAVACYGYLRRRTGVCCNVCLVPVACCTNTTKRMRKHSIEVDKQLPEIIPFGLCNAHCALCIVQQQASTALQLNTFFIIFEEWKKSFCSP